VERDHAADAKDAQQPLGLLCKPCKEDKEKDDQFLSFFQVVEHQWDEVYRRKPKYSVRNLFQCNIIHTQIPHGLTRDRIRASV
jgi:hypothetical protein